MSEALANPTLVINNVAIPIVPNSLKFKGGQGEQTMLAQSSGGGATQSVYSEDTESKISFIGFSLRNTPANIELQRNWKNLKNANAATITGAGGFSRAFNNMAHTNDPDINLGADTPIDIEFMGDPAT